MRVEIEHKVQTITGQAPMETNEQVVRGEWDHLVQDALEGPLKEVVCSVEGGDNDGSASCSLEDEIPSEGMKIRKGNEGLVMKKGCRKSSVLYMNVVSQVGWGGCIKKVISFSGARS